MLTIESRVMKIISVSAKVPVGMLSPSTKMLECVDIFAGSIAPPSIRARYSGIRFLGRLTSDTLPWAQAAIRDAFDRTIDNLPLEDDMSIKEIVAKLEFP